MDIMATVNQLRQELAQIDRCITEMLDLARMRGDGRQQLGGAMERRSTRGRKSMGMEERKEVSARMKRYWASRRKGKTNA